MTNPRPPRTRGRTRRKAAPRAAAPAANDTQQNRQLSKVHAELAEARDRYADLYHLAPIGYLTLDDSGVITEINQAGATLFEEPRASLLNVALSTLVDRRHRTRVQRFLAAVLEGPDRATPSHLEVTLKKASQRIVRLLARTRKERRRIDVLVAMIDMTHERLLEREREESIALEVARATELVGEVSERIDAEERVKTLLDRLVSVQEDERRRLSRNLHDHLGQQLTALRLAVGAIKERDRAAGQRNSRIGVIEAIVSDLDRDIDQLAWDLRPPVLDDHGLPAALDTLVRDWAAMTGVTAEFHAGGVTAPAPRLGRDIESHVYRIVQEALTNVVKDAQATRVSVLMKHAREELSVIVEDDGCGFEAGRVASDHGIGLVSMRERAALAGGEIQIESLAGKGATVFLKIPLKTANSA